MNITFDKYTTEFVLESLGFRIIEHSVWENGERARCFYCLDCIRTDNLAGVINLEGKALICNRPSCLKRLAKEMN